MDPKDRKQQLRRQVAEAARRLQTDPAPEETKPAPGDLYVFPLELAHPVEWLYLDPAPQERETWIVVPADASPLAGSADLAVPARDPAAPLTLRCQQALVVPDQLLAAGKRTGRVSTTTLEAARARWADVRSGTLAGDLLAEEMDDDPEYEDWITDVVEPARKALQALAAAKAVTGGGAGSSAPPAATLPSPNAAGVVDFAAERQRRRPLASSRLWATAASALLFTTLVLGGGAFWQHRQVEEARRELERQAAAAAELQERVATQQLELERRSQEEEALRSELAETTEQLAAVEKDLQAVVGDGSIRSQPIFADISAVRSGAEPFQVPPDIRGLNLEVYLPTDPLDFERLRVEIRSRGDAIVLTETVDYEVSLNQISLFVLRSKMPNGRYEIVLYGLEGNAPPEEIGSKAILLR